jgi:uncharacterized protein with FMN-binding domain
MKRPTVAVMSGLSVAVLGMSVHASERTSPAVVAAPAGLVEVPAPAVPSNADPTRTSEAPSTPPTGSRPAATAAPRPAAKPAARTVVINGSPEATQYGPVQVQITLRGGHIITSEAIAYPQANGRDQEINSQAVPQLNQETLRADSAQIDTVSGATYTSGGYRGSLQSALDAAHRAGAR